MTGQNPLPNCIMCLSFSAAGLITALNTGTFQPPQFSFGSDWFGGNWLNISVLSRFYQRQPSPSVIDGLEIVVDLSARQVQVYEDDQLQVTYPAAIGQGSWETPIGEFQVTQMQENPVWQHPITGELFEPGPENPLGERWIGFWTDGYNQIGFHGTNQANLIGQAVSHGCVRMHNSDIRDLYNRLELGALVTVIP